MSSIGTPRRAEVVVSHPATWVGGAGGVDDEDDDDEEVGQPRAAGLTVADKTEQQHESQEDECAAEEAFRQRHARFEDLRPVQHPASHS
ncbi:hypothetical protein VYL96_15845 [Dietzia cinnamea]|uniref:hypothetical protein n=1 Tax=Dietzia cinnamea TaxID=321318 RepID=UPI00223C1866|nr:hypothetical protein [Dietzia cinnamea]MCT2264868.1 hypothetical protein [Dietzia cinnamea]